MPVEWALSVMVPIFKRKGDNRKCSCHRAVKPLEHEMKLVGRVLEKRLCRVVSVDKMQLGFMTERGAIDAVFILSRMQEGYHAKGKKLYMCFGDLWKALDRVLRKALEWVVRKKGMPEVLVRSVISQYDGAKTRVRMDSKLSELFLIKVEMQQASVLSPFPFAVVVDVATEFPGVCAK